MSQRYLVLQSTYTHLELALADKGQCLATRASSKQEASKKLIPQIEELLAETNTVLTDLLFLGANRGPGPFTTLRTTLASLNGLSLATGLPLVGIDGLRAGLQEHAHPDCAVNVMLLNAFGGDLYFGIQYNDTVETGYRSAPELFSHLATLSATQIYLFGQGVVSHRSEIAQILGNRAVISDPIPDSCSIEQVAASVYDKWRTSGATPDPLLPLYIKGHNTPIRP